MICFRSLSVAAQVFFKLFNFTFYLRDIQVSSGVLADARQLVNRARQEATQYKQFYGDPIPARVLNERVSHHVQVCLLFLFIDLFSIIDSSSHTLFPFLRKNSLTQYTDT